MADALHGLTDPLALAARGLELSGPEYIQAIFSGELPPLIATLMGFRGVEAEPGGRRLRAGAGLGTTTRSGPCTGVWH